jgi:hypothetical protein
MVRSRRKPTRFSVEEANATLPLVRAIVGDLVELGREVYERRQRLAVLLDGRPPGENDPYHQELVQIERELAKDNRRLSEFADELRQLGVEPAGATEGWADFPAVVEGRKAYLCWRHDEPEVLYFHRRKAEHRRRRPLAAGSMAGEDAEDAQEEGQL